MNDRTYIHELIDIRGAHRANYMQRHDGLGADPACRSATVPVPHRPPTQPPRPNRLDRLVRHR